MSSRTVFLGRLIGLYGIIVALSISQTSRFRLAMAQLEIGNNSPPCSRRAMGNRASEGVRFRIFPLCRNSSSGPNRGGSTCCS